MTDSSQAERERRRLAEGRERILEAVMKAEKAGKVAQLPYQNYLVRQVLEAVVQDVREDIAGGSPRAFKKFALYLGTIDLHLAVLRAIQSVLRVLLKAGGQNAPQPVWKKAAAAAGQSVYAEYLATHFKGLSPALFNSVTREYSRSMTQDERTLLAAYKGSFKAAGYSFPTWDFGDLEGVGSYILSRLVAHRFLESWSRTEQRNGKAYTVRYLMLDEQLRSASLALMDRMADLPRVAGPMIEPPHSWDAETNQGGGFHTEEMQRQSPYAVQGKGPGRVAQATVDMLNALQQVEWTINRPVLEAVRAVSLLQDIGSDIVSPIRTEKPPYPEGSTDEEKKEWKGLARAWYTEKRVRAIKHLRAQKVFREASELSQYPTIWFTYYADFRGRAYVRSDSVSPQGTDLEKGLLMLRNGKPLDSDSSRHWFKVHGSNKYGNDKLSLSDRVRWVDDHHAHLLEMAADPVAHTAWTEAEDPVQFLAWVLEYAAWVGDPEGFVSHLPLGQDGTCNGLQNFSALMCDSVGGAAVNLLPGPAPRDIYDDVARRVTELLQEMPPSPMRDAWLAHGINRKVTKRTTMTLPYGCTRYACSQFIVEDYLEKVKPPEIDPKDWGEAGNFLSHVVWRALDDVVVKAREVMEWLQGWAKHAASTGAGVWWIAPSGLHVRSEYEGMRVQTVKSAAFKTRINLYHPTDRPDLKKTANAIAPNFVHSLDASHMARVVARAVAEGMTPVTIHDDFGVHAADTERFHQIIREEFVALYDGNTILQDMAERTGYEVPPPDLGDLDLNEVLHSPYFFS